MSQAFAVTVYASSATGVAKHFFEAAEALGRGIGGRGWTLVYGGNACGPMGRLADGARAAGGRVVGISPAFFGDLIDRQCDKLIQPANMRDRKAAMEEHGDALLTLPGGVGTLEEFFEATVGRQLAQHDKPIVLVNVAGYYDPLLDWLRRGTDEGFVRASLWEQLDVADTVDDALAKLDASAASGLRAE